MNRNWTIKSQFQLLKPKREINKYNNYTKDNKKKWPTERAAIPKNCDLN